MVNWVYIKKNKLGLSHAFSSEDPNAMTISCMPQLSNSLTSAHGTNEAKMNGNIPYIRMPGATNWVTVGCALL